MGAMILMFMEHNVIIDTSVVESLAIKRIILLLSFIHHNNSINLQYVLGVSVTHGKSPYEHIWTFAGARDEDSANYRWKCPCINPNLNPTPRVPSFIGNDYFCDTALANGAGFGHLYTSDPLWDGEGCGPTNTCCYDPEREVNPPWFVKTLSSPTSDDIEMRVCLSDPGGSTQIEIVEIYVHARSSICTLSCFFGYPYPYTPPYISLYFVVSPSLKLNYQFSCHSQYLSDRISDYHIINYVLAYPYIIIHAQTPLLMHYNVHGTRDNASRKRSGFQTSSCTEKE